MTNVFVNGQPLDVNSTYTVASHNYMIKEGGSGLNMFMDDALLQDCTMCCDNQLLIDYITGYLGERRREPVRGSLRKRKNPVHRRPGNGNGRSSVCY